MRNRNRMKRQHSCGSGWAFLAILPLLCGAACADLDFQADDDPREVRLVSYHNCELSIGKGPGASMVFPYDARGPASHGTMSLDCAGLDLDGRA